MTDLAARFMQASAVERQRMIKTYPELFTEDFVRTLCECEEIMVDSALAVKDACDAYDSVANEIDLPPGCEEVVDPRAFFAEELATLQHEFFGSREQLERVFPLHLCLQFLPVREIFVCERVCDSWRNIMYPKPTEPAAQLEKAGMFWVAVMGQQNPQELQRIVQSDREALQKTDWRAIARRVCMRSLIEEWGQK